MMLIFGKLWFVSVVDSGREYATCAMRRTQTIMRDMRTCKCMRSDDIVSDGVGEGALAANYW